MKFLLVFSVLWTSFALVIHGYPYADNNEQTIIKLEEDKEANAEDVGDVSKEASERQTEATYIDRSGHEDQPFYPSFAPYESEPLGHSRPYYYQQQQQEGAYSQREASPYQQQIAYDTYRGGNSFSPSSTASTHGLLGSGNFGVIRGGTFYNDNDHDPDASNFEEQYSPYYRNGHGRPSLYFGRLGNPRPQQHEQFANFRDFADINTPSYSEYVVVYANKNGSKHHHDGDSGQKHKGPKNIIEQLAMLDLEVTTASSSSVEVPTKKVSKSKRKLALLLPEKKMKRKEMAKIAGQTNLDLHEPLLALS